MSLSGKWEGKLLDASGSVASLVLNLQDQRGKLMGDFAISFLPLGDAACCNGQARLAQTGVVAGESDAKRGSVKLTYQVTIGLEPVAVSFTAQARKADPHARRALVGQYDVEKGRQALTMEGGSCILWQYAS